MSTTYTGPDDISRQLLAALQDEVVSYTSIQTRLASADGDRDKAIQSWMDSSEDAAAIKLRNSIAQFQAKLLELAEKNVVTETLSDDEKAKLAAESETHRDKIRKGREAIKSVASSLGTDPDGVMAALEEIGDPTRSGRGRKPGTTGSSLPRVSANLIVTGGNLDHEHYDSFSKVATILNCEVKDLQVAFADAAGVDHASIKTVNKPVTFKFQPNSNGAEYTIETTPKARQKPGPKSAKVEETETVSESASE